jgi:hypothetical protein
MAVETAIILDVARLRTRRLPMKKAGMILAATLMLLASLPVFAQTSAAPKDAYYKIMPIIKIWSHQLGYKIQFWSSKSTVNEIYVPVSWFNKGTESKADIFYGNDRQYPYFAIFWVGGKFDHINIYALDDFHSLTWGVLESATDLASQFNVQDVPLNF